MRATKRLRAAAWTLLLAGACSAPGPGPLSDRWIYHVALRDGGDELDVRLTLPAGPARHVTVAPAALPFLSDVKVDLGSSPQSLLPIDGAFAIPAANGPRELQWRFLARRASLRIDDIELAAWRGTAFVGSLGAFLLFPTDGAEQPPFELRVDAGAFACAAPRTASGWTGALQDLSMLPSCAFGGVVRRTIAVDESHTVEVVDLGRRGTAASKAVDAWAHEAATALRTYCGVFPVPHVLLLIAPGQQPSITGGSARGLGGGARLFVDVPAAADADDLRRDWVLFHEMIHLVLPSMPPQHHWLEEGSAVYLEPLLQARAGRVSEHDVWKAMLADYPQGLAEAGAGGLDDDHSWGRTYYGGAIFCLRADVEIRRRSDNTRSLQDAMRAVVAAGGNIRERWPIEDVLRLADAATGSTVFAELYAAMRSAPEPRELQSLWRELGVRLEGERVVFDDTAPLATVRRALVLGR